VAIQAAGGLTLAGAGLFLFAWKSGLEPGERTPRWLPVPLVLGVLTASVVFYCALNAEQNQDISQTVKAGAESVKNQITLRIDARTRSVVRMAQRWNTAGGTPRAAWENDAANYVHDFPDLQALEWIDPTHHVRWIVPLAGNEAKLGLDLTLEPHRKAAVAQAEQEQQPVMTPIVQLFRGGAGFVIYVPLRVKGQPGGFVAAIIKAQTGLDRYLSSSVAAGEALEFSDGGKVFYTRDAGEPPLNMDWIAQDKVEMHGATWTFRIWPTPALASHLYSPLPQVILFAGALGALLLGATCFFAQRSSRSASETARKNAALEAALEKVRTLEGLLPICSCCKRVRDDTGYWNQIDTYLGQHTNASLSHGYCPECAAKTFKEFGFEVPESIATALEAGNFER
jgi:sensor domain CHASE-containing protein